MGTPVGAAEALSAGHQSARPLADKNRDERVSPLAVPEVLRAADRARQARRHWMSATTPTWAEEVAAVATAATTAKARAEDARTRTELRRSPDMPDPSHLVVARVHGVAARSAELRAAAEELADSSAAQDGCVSFEVLAPRGAGAELVLLSAWQNGTP